MCFLWDIVSGAVFCPNGPPGHCFGGFEESEAGGMVAVILSLSEEGARFEEGEQEGLLSGARPDCPCGDAVY